VNSLEEGPTEEPSDGLITRLGLASDVRVRHAKTCTLLLAGDGTTVLAFSAEDLAALTRSAGPARDELRSELAEAGMLAGSPQPAAAPRVSLTRSGVEVAGFDTVARRVAAITGRIPGWLRVCVAVVFGVCALAGGRYVASADAAGISALQAAGLLVALEFGLLIVHELGHGAVLSSAGGKVGRVGFGFHWGAPSFYVDSSAALFLPRRTRIWQAAAGVITEVAVVGALVVVAAVTGSPLAGYIAGAAAVVALADFVVNAAPVLGLDGSWILSDVLDRPTLPTGSGRAVDRRERRYRALNAVVGAVAIAVSLWLWSVLWWGLLPPLWNAGMLGKCVAVATVAPTVAACGVGAATLLFGQRRAGVAATSS
jgi:putative peptide zinc metalloprotease protein